jgi:O-antigen/teichoic acid export membrane protein
MSSLTNYLLSFMLAHLLGESQFGAFTLAYMTYGFALCCLRGISSEPLLIRFSHSKLLVWRRAVSKSTGTALLVGLSTGICAIAAGLLMGGVAGSAFLGLGLMLPALMLQESWRFAFFAAGKAYHAFINDSIWAAVQVPLLIALKLTGHTEIFWFVIAFPGARRAEPGWWRVLVAGAPRPRPPLPGGECQRQWREHAAEL